MDKAILKDNKIFCPKCEQSKYQLTDDYKLVNIGGKNYTEFVARCLTENCNEKFYFQSIITMDKTTHFVFNRERETVIKED